METQYIVRKACDAGYALNKDEIIFALTARMVCDPLFWQALCKACGWDDKETGFYFKEINEKDSIVILDEFVNISLKFHEINLTQGFDKAVEWLAEQVK